MIPVESCLFFRDSFDVVRADVGKHGAVFLTYCKNLTMN